MKITDLLEAEGRSLRSVVNSEAKSLKKATASMAMAVAVLCILAPLAIIGLALLFLALFLSLKDTIGAPGAAAITGVVTLAVCGGLLWMFKALTT